MNFTIAKRLWLMIAAAAVALLIVGASGLLTASRLNSAIDVANL